MGIRYFFLCCIERLARFSCSLPLSIFLFSPTHNVLHKKLILHLQAACTKTWNAGMPERRNAGTPEY